MNAAPPAISAKSALLVASPDNPQKPVVHLGSAVWSTIPPAPGQPATVAVKADADIPDLKMHATMTLRKNIDPTLEATHTIGLKFSFADGAPITGFKDVGLPQMRKLDSTAAETLTSVKVKISDVYFLIALANGEQDIARNLDLMETRAWFDFPLLLNDDRIAKLVFQKSAEGQAMLERAFDAWKDEASGPPASADKASGPPGRAGTCSDIVPLKFTAQRTFSVPVTLGEGPASKALDMTVDTGAAISGVPPGVADALIAAKQAVELQKQTVTFPTGDRKTFRAIRIKTIRVGCHVVPDVIAIVINSQLIGLPALRQSGRITIDAYHEQLIFNDDPTVGGGGVPPWGG